MFSESKAIKLKTASDAVKAATGQPSKLEQVFCKSAPDTILVLEAIKELASSMPVVDAIDLAVLDIVTALQTHFCDPTPTPEA